VGGVEHFSVRTEVGHRQKELAFARTRVRHRLIKHNLHVDRADSRPVAYRPRPEVVQDCQLKLVYLHSAQRTLAIGRLTRAECVELLAQELKAALLALGGRGLNGDRRARARRSDDAYPGGFSLRTS